MTGTSPAARRLLTAPALVACLALVVVAQPVVASASSRTEASAPTVTDEPRMIPPDVKPYRGEHPVQRRVLLVGDSTMSGMQQPLRRELAAAGYAAFVWNSARGATGIGGTWPKTDFDWLERIRPILAEVRPDIVVVQFIGSFGTFESTRERGARFVEICHRAGAKVVWVRSPAVVPQTPGYQAYYDRIIDAMDRIPADAFADWRGLVSPDDRWVEYGITDRGREQIRSDGLHLTDAGKRLVAKETAAVISRYWPKARATKSAEGTRRAV